MIEKVDEALRHLVRTQVLEGSDVDVVLEAPTKEWASRRNAPTVNLYLYDIREDLRRREVGWHEERAADGTVLSRRPVPRWFKLSYLVTAWTQRPEDEHRLLASLLRLFLRHDAVPRDLVAGALAEPGLAVPMTVGLPPPEDRAFADVWSALGGELKPSLDVVVTAPVGLGVVYPVAPPPHEGTHLDLRDTVGGGEDTGQRLHVPPARVPVAVPPADAQDGGSTDDSAAGSRSAARRPRQRKRS